MNISPLDIRKHEFKRSMRGYDVEEVTAFLDMVSLEYEKLISQNAMNQERIQHFESQLKKYHDIEGTLQETLLSAERAREDTVKTAKKQAEVIIREAEVKAASIIEEGRRTYTELRNAIITLKVQKDSYIAKLKSLMNAQLEVFDSFSFDAEEQAVETVGNLPGVKPQAETAPMTENDPANSWPPPAEV